MKSTLTFLLFLICVAPLAASARQTKPADESHKTAATDDSHKSKATSRESHAKSDDGDHSKAAAAKLDEKTHPAASKHEKSAKARSHHSKSGSDDTLADIEHERVDYWVAAFSKMHDYHKKIAAGFVRKAKYQDVLEKKLRQHGMPQNLIYLAFEESAFDPAAGSREKAVGIWQLTPATARLYGLKVNKKVDERHNVDKETDAALRFLSHLHKRFGCWYLAAAAYDSGENRIARLMKKRFGREHGRDGDYYKIWDAIPGETRDYVPAIIALKRIGRDPARYGF